MTKDRTITTSNEKKKGSDKATSKMQLSQENNNSRFCGVVVLLSEEHTVRLGRSCLCLQNNLIKKHYPSNQHLPRRIKLEKPDPKKTCHTLMFRHPYPLPFFERFQTGFTIRRREFFRIHSVRRIYNRVTKTFSFHIAYETAAELTPRTVALAEAFGLGIDEARKSAILE